MPNLDVLCNAGNLAKGPLSDFNDELAQVFAQRKLYAGVAFRWLRSGLAVAGRRSPSSFANDRFPAFI
jgi:hypothetical protein